MDAHDIGNNVQFRCELDCIWQAWGGHRARRAKSNGMTKTREKLTEMMMARINSQMDCIYSHFLFFSLCLMPRRTHERDFCRLSSSSLSFFLHLRIHLFLFWRLRVVAELLVVACLSTYTYIVLFTHTIMHGVSLRCECARVLESIVSFFLYIYFAFPKSQNSISIRYFDSGENAYRGSCALESSHEREKLKQMNQIDRNVWIQKQFPFAYIFIIQKFSGAEFRAPISCMRRWLKHRESCVTVCWNEALNTFFVG